MAVATSYKEIEEHLKIFKEKVISASETGYILLQAFGMTTTSIERVRSGKMNVAKFDGILVKKKLAFRAVSTEQLSTVLEEMKNDVHIAKATPCIIAVTDGSLICAYDPREKESYENKLSKLWLDFQFFYPLAGVEKYKNINENVADIKAAEKMAKLYDEIRCYNEISSEESVHDLNIFMTRLLFCFFAEETDIFEKNLFTNSIRQFTQEDGSDLSDYLDACFNVMDKDMRIGIPSSLSQFPYVNGGLFRKHISIPKMGYKARRIILECGELNWAEINPDIFGSMIQAVVSPDMRAGLGMHYTSVPNIMKLIGPLFLNDFYEEYQAAQHSEKKLNALLVRISKAKFLDPACGSGNFLIIAYKELRRLEILIWKCIRELTKQARIPFVSIQLHQFYGIEIDDFCHETAILSLWLAEHQMNKEFSKEFDVKIQALPLRPSGNIICANACRIDWEDVCPHTREEEVYIMGNPPYLGARLQNKEQKNDMETVLQSIKKHNNLDYIACWFYNGAQYIKDSIAKYSFVSTNSICQGEQVALLWDQILSNKMGLEIFFAHSSFKWSNNAKSNAGVICIIIGVQNKQKGDKLLFRGPNKIITSNINAYLTQGTNSIVKPLSKSLYKVPKMSFGNMPNDGGTLLLDKDQMRNLVVNFPETKIIIRKFLGSLEYIRGEEKYCLWIPDDLKKLAYSIKPIKDRIDKCGEIRAKSKRGATNKLSKNPHLFGEVRHEETDSIIIPRVSSERREYIPIGFLRNDIIISDSAFAIYDAQMWLFGIITSKMHMVWVKSVGGRLKSDIRYSATLCYNTFPFPTISEGKKKAIEIAAEEVLLVRAEYPRKTLAEMYDPDKMPDNLRQAHHDLDLVVESCYRKEPFSNDEERLEHLFKLYEKMTSKK